MTKINVIDLNGNKKSELYTEIFNYPAREDIVQKIVEIEKQEEKQPYAPFLWAGMQTSASGSVKHNRHVWKTDRGKGMSRFPKKRMSDKGDRFVWIGAVSSETRGGRRAHPPKIERKELKINKKERVLALKSALSMTSSLDLIKNKYFSLKDLNIKMSLPLIFEDKTISTKTGEFYEKLEKLLGKEIFSIAIQTKKVRCGIGKMRSRRYKQNAGMLVLIGNKQEKKIAGLEVKKVNEIKLMDLWDNGTRLIMFTEQAIKDLEDKLSGRKEAQIENKK